LIIKLGEIRMNKKINVLLLSLIILFSGFSATVFAKTDISVILNGVKLIFEQPPVIVNGRTLVPLRVIFEAIGAKVNWDPNNKTITAVKDTMRIELQIDQTKVLKNQEVINLDAAPQIINGRTFVPLRFVSESFDSDVQWDDINKTVTITTEQTGQQNVKTSTPTPTPTPTPPTPTAMSVVDTQAPVVLSSGASISPNSVSVGGKVTYEFNATDDVGVVYQTVRVMAPNGLQAGWGEEFTLISGTVTNGRWRGDFTIPNGYPTGTWTLTASVIDGVFHNAEQVTLGTFEVK
jgi:hypothetical protein